VAAQLTAVLFALHREARPFLHRLRGVEAVREAPCPAWRAEGELLVLVTGMGRAATERALDWLLAQAPRQVISAGYCGSLVAEVRVGDVFPSCAGELVSVDRPVMTIPERRELHQRTGAVVVDMESATVARRCEAAGVTCRCLRVVSDDFASPLPADLLPAFEGERVDSVALLRALCRRPWRVVDLLRLARHTREASLVLAKSLQRLLTTENG
jgi:nucleoside phosphorylase